MYRLYIRIDTFCLSATVIIILRTVQYGTTISNGMGQLCDAIKRRPAASAGAARPRAFTSSLSPSGTDSSDYVGIWITLSFSRFLAVERKLRRNEHCASRDANSSCDMCAVTFVAKVSKLIVKNALKT